MLYGTLEQGSIFKINKDGSGFSTLSDFRADGEDISRPAAELMEGSDGALYGAAYGFSGLVFRLNKDGSDYTVLHSFDLNSNDGSYPQAALIEGNDGALYGTTVAGGVHNAGTVFKLGKDGSGYKVLYSFNDAANGLGGYTITAFLVEGNDGALYGTTSYGGSVFKLKKDGSGFMVLLSALLFLYRHVLDTDILTLYQRGNSSKSLRTRDGGQRREAGNPVCSDFRFT
jgi:uncharacterized repeat protein (TIGR03803 family)